MYKTQYGYRHKQYDIKRGSYIGTSDDSINGWYVDHNDSDGIDRRGTGFATLRDAVENINQVDCRHNSYQWNRARRGDL